MKTAYLTLFRSWVGLICCWYLGVGVLGAGEGGTIYFHNRVLLAGLDAPVFHLDGETRLAGEEYLAQLYAGPTADSLEPVGWVVPFMEGVKAGYVASGTVGGVAANVVTLPNVGPGEEAYLQLRAWAAQQGYSYVEAVASGGHAGVSEVFVVVAGGGGVPPSVPANMVGLSSFSLRGEPMIWEQPVGGWVLPGGDFLLGAEVMSSGGGVYQWYLDGVEVPGANDVQLLVGGGGGGVSGWYQLVFEDVGGRVVSDAVQLRLLASSEAGAVFFSNRFGQLGVDAPVMGMGGELLEGPNYVAQLYAGLDSDALQPVGEPCAFGVGVDAGYWGLGGEDVIRLIPGVEAGAVAYVQARFWSLLDGASYEEAMAAGGAIGSSATMEVMVGAVGEVPVMLAGLGELGVGTVPVWLEEPMDARRQVGQSVVFRGVVEGLEPMQLQWFHDGQAIAGADQAELRIDDLQLVDGGRYRLEAMNVQGVTGREVFLDVTGETAGGTLRFVAPEGRLSVFVGRQQPLWGDHFVAQLWVGPSAESLLPVGEPCRFSESAAGAGLWEPAADPVCVAGNVAAGVPAYCVIKVWDTRVAGTFEEVIELWGAAGKTQVFEVVAGGWGEPSSEPATLESMGWVVVTQPTAKVEWTSRDQIVVTKEPVILGVRASPVIGLSYTWLKSVPFSGWQVVSQGTSSELLLDPKVMQVEGEYAVVVSNVGGEVWSPVMRVYAPKHVRLGRPGWEQLRLELTGEGGAPFVIEASADLGEWEAIYQVDEDARYLEFSDPLAEGMPSRFYRVLSLETGGIVSRAPFGFVELYLPPGYSMRTNPLWTGDDTVGGVLRDLPDGTVVYKYRNGEGFMVISQVLGEWSHPAEPLEPGEGFFVLSGAAEVLDVAVVGEVPVGRQSIEIPEGWSILACPAPFRGRVDEHFGMPLERDDNVDLLSPLTAEYQPFVSDGSGGWYSGPDLSSREGPVIGLGEGYWFYSWRAKTWEFEW